MTLAKENAPAAPGPAAQGADKRERPTSTKSRPEDLEDRKKGVEFEADEQLHLRGGAGRASTRYTSTTTRKSARTRASTGSSSNSRQSYVSYGSGGKANSYVSYGSGQEKKYKKPVTATPRMMSDVGRKVLYYLESLRTHCLVNGLEPGVLGFIFNSVVLFDIRIFFSAQGHISVWSIANIGTQLGRTENLYSSVSTTMFIPEWGNQVLWPGRVGGPGQNGRFGHQGNGGQGQGQNQAVWPGAVGGAGLNRPFGGQGNGGLGQGQNQTAWPGDLRGAGLNRPFGQGQGQNQAGWPGRPGGVGGLGQNGRFAPQGRRGQGQDQNQAQQIPRRRGQRNDQFVDLGGRRVNMNDLVKFPKYRGEEEDSDGKKGCVVL
ncbi:hypothetical protein L207DRAFT_536746 [Hyaloscypha variabilis F]|uniref:Uncharacterized protein n=1 Tax=Hyaloscypha variabilis (strain UAMH 11265 / GT02V1 / F) TaxID=1149755 RepID=A0A2J6QZU9_HYAVF|nr:hypothetical protein L207DRAFT_536746 [Hyaloscypha variabilis F]